MKKLILFSIFCSLLSCQSIIKSSLGVKPIAFKTEQEQINFLNRNNVLKQDYFYFKDINSFSSASKKKYLKVPDAYFFNKKGDLVPYKKSVEECNGGVSTFIADLKDFNKAPSNSKQNVKDYLSLLNSTNEIIMPDTDITVFLNWAIFMGDVNKQKTFAWIELLEQAKKEGIKISYFLVNADMQDSWDLTVDQKRQIEKEIRKSM